MMEEAFTLDREVAQKLGKNYTIRVGKYKFEKKQKLLQSKVLVY
ncbi:hypothetical protein N9D69_00150 [Flavobacteriales bacterium]|jgi:hypothetical protein|nr:hypothetical protein [Flavobacteriales bacterium]